MRWKKVMAIFGATLILPPGQWDGWGCRGSGAFDLVQSGFFHAPAVQKSGQSGNSLQNNWAENMGPDRW
jgi:hypothetical protein